MWAAGGAVLAAFLVGTLIVLAVPGEHYTGTNNIAVQSLVVKVRGGRELCVPDLQIPAGTGRVRIAAFWAGRTGPAFAGRLEAEGRPRLGRAGPGVHTNHRVDIPFAPGPAARGARFCVRPLGRDVALGGKKELLGRHPLPTLDGHRVEREIALWFLPPKGEQRSVLGLLGRALHRAALFRPGWVGAWTYVLLLFVLEPLLWLVALRLVATRAAGRTGGARTALAVGGVAFAAAATWGLITPPFDAPDEPEHYSYVQTLAETGDLPDKAPGRHPPYSSRLTISLDTLRLYGRVQQKDERAPWTERGRTSAGRDDDGGGYLVASSTHAPPYYALSAAAYLATPSHDTFSKLLSMRLLSALLAGLTAALTFLALRELLPRREWAAVAGGLLVAFQPMFGFIAGSVNNDNGVNAAAALLMFLLLRGLRRGLTWRLGLALGTTLVLLPLVKGTGYALYPAAIVAVAGMVWRRHGRPELPGYAAVAGSFVALQAAWAAIAGGLGRATFTTPGGQSPTASTGLLGGVVRHPLDYLNYVWQVFLPRLPFMKDVAIQHWPAFNIYVERGWAAFGWYAMEFPKWVYVVIAAAMLGAGALCALAVWRERGAARPQALEIAVLLLALVGVIGGVEAAYFTTQGRLTVAEQGRYAFTAMVPLAAIAVGATFAFGRRRAPVLAGAGVAAVAGLTLASHWLALTRFFT